MDSLQVVLRSIPDLQRHIAKGASGLITFDGDLSAGKTTLAEQR